MRPFVVIEERPRVVAAEVRALFHCLVRGAQVLAKIFHAQWILDAAVDRVRRIVERRAVLRDIDRGLAVPLGRPEQDLRQRLGENFPLGVCLDVLGLRHVLGAERKILGIVALDSARVVVHSQKVDRLLDQPHVLVRPLGPCLAEDLAHLLRVAAEEYRVQVLPVHVGVGAAHGREILRRIRRRVLGLQVHRDADLAPLRGLAEAESLYRQAVRTKKIVSGDWGLEQIGVAGRQHARQISAVGHHPRLVERRPHLYTVAQRIEHRRRIVAEPTGDVAVEPAATVIECLREIPVIERGVRLDAALEKRIDQPRIEVDSLFVDGAGARGKDARPRDAEPIGVRTKLGHDRDVVLVAPVVLASDVARLVEPGVARSVREAVPDAASGAIGGGRSFDLVGGRCCSPHEIIGEPVGAIHSNGRFTIARAKAWRV